MTGCREFDIYLQPALTGRDRMQLDQLKRRDFITLLGGISLLPALPARAQAPSPAPIAYQTFQKKTLQLRPFVGRNVALLLNPTRQADPFAINRVLSAIDRTWDWYNEMFGRAPAPYFVHQGKASIAEVEDNDGAPARGFFAHTGIQLMPPVMEMLLTQAGSRDRYHQAVFYEMGRNFWFFGDPLGRIAATANGGVLLTGFAHVNRFYSMEAAGLMGAPWNASGFDFELARHDVLVDILDRYLANRTLTWENTLEANKPPANPNGWGADALAAALFHKIRRDHGTAGYRRFWHLMMGAPKAETARDSAARFVQIARAATGTDYRELLRDPSLPLSVETATMPAGLPRRIVFEYKGPSFNNVPARFTGEFTRATGNEWIETRNYDPGFKSSARSLSETDSEVFCYDSNSDTYYKLDLKSRRVDWRRGASPTWYWQGAIVEIRK